MTGTRQIFLPGTANFIIRYGRRTHYQRAAVYLPDWTPDIGELPEWPVCHVFQGGTWAGSLGFDAMGVEEGFQLEVVQMLSNEMGAVVICHDYTPAGRAASTIEDLERVFWPEILDDGALVVQHFKTIAEDDMFGDRPLTRDPNLIVGIGSSSGGHRLAMSQMLPDGAFDYSPDRASRDVWIPTHSHILNPMILAITPLAMSAFSKGVADYSFFNVYEDASWAFPLFQSARDEEEPGWGWDNIPMSLKRQSDIAELIRADNPRVAQVGLYLTAGHPASFIPRPTITNDPTGVDARSFKRRYWRWTGVNPEPIELLRTVVVEDVLGSGQVLEFIIGPGPGEATIRRLIGDWPSDDYEVGDIVATSNWDLASNNDAWEVLRFENSDQDMVVADTDGKAAADAASNGQNVSGGGYYDLHDEWVCYDTYHRMSASVEEGGHANPRCRLRAGAQGNTNPDPLTIQDLATATDVKDWLKATDGTGFGWVEPS